MLNTVEAQIDFLFLFVLISIFREMMEESATVYMCNSSVSGSNRRTPDMLSLYTSCSAVLVFMPHLPTSLSMYLSVYMCDHACTGCTRGEKHSA